MKRNSNARFTAEESRAALSLAGIYALRMLGLFLILPVFALYARELDGYTPFLAGLAIGIYGLTQAVLQIPFGMLSDRIGRKPVIVLGLAIFAIGSGVAAEAETIEMVLLGRALQGSGAIAAAIMALAADLTREQSRTGIMAVIGMSIGAAFALSMVLAPVLHGVVGVPGIFWITALLALGGILVTLLLVPQPPHRRFHRDTQARPGELLAALRDPQLLRLDFGILVLHLVLTSLFVVLPPLLRDNLQLPADDHWELYLPVMLAAMVLMVPFVVVAERRRRIKEVLFIAVAMLVGAQLALHAAQASLPLMAAAMVLFFTAFNILEASLPSLVSKLAPAAGKGAAMGAYSTSQFFGAFLGGATGGAIHQHFGLGGVFLFCALVLLGWLALVATMAQPRHLRNYLLDTGDITLDQAQHLGGLLRGVRGIEEVDVIAEDRLAYLKFDAQRISEPQIDEIVRRAM